MYEIPWGRWSHLLHNRSSRVCAISAVKKNLQQAGLCPAEVPGTPYLVPSPLGEASWSPQVHRPGSGGWGVTGVPGGPSAPNSDTPQELCEHLAPATPSVFSCPQILVCCAAMKPPASLCSDTGQLPGASKRCCTPRSVRPLRSALPQRPDWGAEVVSSLCSGSLALLEVYPNALE